ncbi:UPF0489 family protein [Paenibacillus marchantiae]|uniref:UPF0489 family protein n=1 Tax=Paenibacillus marchantiae TaxID=3026433 RepID=UPI00237BE358|nr:UPF0489 family protein [Paenibacillus marchantiae]WDQ34964.1 UPF0489 family protein [Paenibacillus marchantiae]
MNRICFPEKRVYIMRDHNWAYYAWDIAKSLKYINKESSLIHVDAHLDDLFDQLEIVDNGWDTVDSLQDSHDYASKTAIDEFLAPAFAKGLFNNIIFLSNENVPDAFHEGNQTIMGREYRGAQFTSFSAFKSQIESGKLNSLLKGRTKVLDLDLDYFNLGTHMYSGQILKSDNEIVEILTYLKNYPWDFITVAQSPEFCGDDDAAKHIYNLFCSVFDLNIEDATYW